MKATKPSTRRNFLLAAGLGGAVAAAATGGKGAPAGAQQASPQDPARGYRVTDHVRKYYKTTEV